MPFDNKLTLVDRKGRKYLTAAERQSFIQAARTAEHPEVQTLALMLTYTGCRISEALAVRMCDVDLYRSLVISSSLANSLGMGTSRQPIKVVANSK